MRANQRRRGQRIQMRNPRKKSNFSLNKIGHTGVLNTIPSMTGVSKDREVVMTCSSVVSFPALYNSDARGTLYISPAISNRLATFNLLYEEVRLDKLTFTTMPMYGTSVPGMFAHAIDYNCSDDATSTYAFDDILSMNGSCSKAIYLPSEMSFHPQDAGDRMFGESNSTTTFRADAKRYCYRWAVALPENPASATYYFKIVVSMTVTYKKLRAQSQTTALALLSQQNATTVGITKDSLLSDKVDNDSHMNLETSPLDSQ